MGCVSVGCVSVGLCSSIVSVFVSNEWICAWASVRIGGCEDWGAGVIPKTFGGLSSGL